MTRKLMFPVFAAMVLVLILTTAAFAADVPTYSPYRAGGVGINQGGYGSCLDADGDGVCDYLHTQPQPADGTGRQLGAGARRP